MSFAAGIIAAGEGSRLSSRYPGIVKPLIPIAGQPLSHWVVRALRAGGARELTILTNSQGKGVPDSLSFTFRDFTFDFMMADTASSFESFRLVSHRLAEHERAFLISTVDAILPAKDVTRFWTECRAAGCDAGLALTAYVEDEKPLWVDVNETGLVSAVGASAHARRYVTCGLYYMTRAASEKLPEPSAHARLRDYWHNLVASGARVSGPILSKTIDVDRPEDVSAAESYLVMDAE